MHATRETTEREFHDRRFAAGGDRGLSSGFYRVAEQSRKYYRNAIRQRALGASVLEIGCGPDGEGLRVAPNARSVVGIDLSGVAVEGARRLAEAQQATNTEFLIMNAERLEFAPASFDLVFGAGILHHLELEPAYARIANVLASDGTAIFLEPLGLNPIINAYRALTPNARTPDEHPLTRADLAMARAFFEVAEIRYFNLTSLAAYAFGTRAFFEPVLAALDRLDASLFAGLPMLRAYAWIAVLVLRHPRKPAATAT